MRFVTHNEEEIDITDDRLVGEIAVSFCSLVRVFGPPQFVNLNCGIDAQWRIKFDDGTVATIYNWRNGASWLGKNAAMVSEIYRWRIGGKEAVASPMVMRAIEESLTRDHAYVTAEQAGIHA